MDSRSLRLVPETNTSSSCFLYVQPPVNGRRGGGLKGKKKFSTGRRGSKPKFCNVNTNGRLRRKSGGWIFQTSRRKLHTLEKRRGTEGNIKLSCIMEFHLVINYHSIFLTLSVFRLTDNDLFKLGSPLF